MIRVTLADVEWEIEQYNRYEGYDDDEYADTDFPYNYLGDFEWCIGHDWYDGYWATNEYSKWLPISLYNQEVEEKINRTRQQQIKEFFEKNF